LIEVLKGHQQITLFKVTKFGKCVNMSTKFMAGLPFIQITSMAVLDYLSIGLLLIISNYYSTNLHIPIYVLLGFYIDYNGNSLPTFQDKISLEP